MTKHKTLRFFWTAFSLSLLTLLLQVMPALAQRAAGKPDSVDTWSAGPDMPTTLVRAVGVFFPADGNFYTVGGRTSDAVGSDFQHVLKYNPTSNMWTQTAVTLPDNFMNNMACGVLTVSGTPYIYCVGGSFATGGTAAARVFFYNPATDTATSLTAADNWPGDAAGTILPGGFAVANNKLYTLGGFNILVSSTNEIWEFDPTAAIGSKWTQKVNTPEGVMYAPTCTIGGKIYLAGASDFSGGTVIDTTNSFSFNPIANTIGTIAPIPRATGETRALNVYGQMWVMGGGRVAPNPSTEVDIYNPYCDSWTVSSQPFMTPRRNFPTDTDGVSRVWLSGGYASDQITPLASMEIDKFPKVTSAVSRKVHTGVGPFDIALPLNGPVGIESRTGPTYQMVVTFSTSVTVGTATVTCGTGSATFSGNGTNTITVNLTGVTDAQRITVTLGSVSDGTNIGDIPISMGVLVGDVNANGAVNASDVALTKSQVGFVVGSSNFREDVNANGAINAGDVAIVKSELGTSLPPL